MKYLVDANVLSEPTKPEPNSAVVQWLIDHESKLAVSSIVLGELEYGILILPAGRRRRRLESWFAAGAEMLRVLDFDRGAAAEWSRMLARLKRNGRAMPVKDSLIAATALANGLTMVTRNLVDFKNSGVDVLDPFA